MILPVSQLEERDGRVREVVGEEAVVLDEEALPGGRLQQEGAQVLQGHHGR